MNRETSIIARTDPSVLREVYTKTGWFYIKFSSMFVNKAPGTTLDQVISMWNEEDLHPVNKTQMATSRNGNILVTGTPGVGKSCVASKVAKRLKLEHINISELAKENNFILEYDTERECQIIDEKKIVKHLKKKIPSGNLLIEYHSCDFFPSKWFDSVYVLRTDSDELYRRLSKRDYPEEKIKENVECEIFQTILEEAHEKFDSKVTELQNNNHEQLQYNVRLIVENVKSIEKK